MPVAHYYSSLSRLKALHDRVASKLPVNTCNASACRIWQAEARERLHRLLGLERMEPCDPAPRKISEEAVPEGGREKWLIQTEPDVWMPFYVLVPAGLAPGARAPVVIAPHGHGSAGKLAVAGCGEIPAVRDAIRRNNYDYGRQFCAQGYVVLCPDARGFGERREFYFGEKRDEDETDETWFMDSSCALLNQKAIALGTTLAAMWTWDLMRLIDYAATRRDCDTTRLACAGFSGGGLQTLWLSALDKRIRCAVVSCNFFGFRDSIIHQTRCSCSYVPGLCEWFDVGDIGALIAPQPLFIEAATEDFLSGPRGIVNTIEPHAITREAYEALGAGDRIQLQVVEGPHRWDGTQVWPFVRRWLDHETRTAHND
ncbi:MAG: hypothetical protein H7A44_08160 [Opitutaceae bacterium]|nr:hypothetical protein [Cephaloticoccus sp.]MCP5530403.1 hypothetical protein [Opitutaceae bacterium]